MGDLYDHASYIFEWAIIGINQEKFLISVLLTKL